MPKVFNRFEPSALRPLEECERYYREVATPLAQDLLSKHPNTVSYTQLRVLREYDLAGGWKQPLTAWRFVIMCSRDDGLADGRHGRASAVATGDDTRQALAQSNMFCLRELKRTPVEERVLLDRLTGQTALDHYLFEYDRPHELPADDARQRLERLADRFTELAHDAFGVRRIVLNTVLWQSRTLPVNEPGQRLTDEILDETFKAGYLQVYFDDVEWGDQFFRRADVRSVVRDPAYSVANGYHVDERCGFDKR
jgi:hypothetical protein